MRHWTEESCPALAAIELGGVVRDGRGDRVTLRRGGSHVVSDADLYVSRCGLCGKKGPWRG